MVTCSSNRKTFVIIATVLLTVLGLLANSLYGGSRPASAGGYAWTPLGLFGGSVQDIVYSPNFATDRTVFAAVAGVQGHGIFRSTDGGLSWAPANNGIPFGPTDSTPYVVALAISPNFAADRTLFAATKGGLLRSTDGGDSWSVISPDFAESLAISPNFAADRTLFAASFTAIYRSTDDGDTWQQGSYCCGDGLAVSPDFADDRTVFAGRSRSTDGGETFTEVIPGYASGQAFAFSPAYLSDGTVFAGTGWGEVLVSTDRGDTWTTVGDAGNNILSLAISPLYTSDQTLWAGTAGTGLRRSVDGGQTWQPLTNGISSDDVVYAVALSPFYASDGLILAGTLSGLYRSTDRGDHWTPSQVGILGREVYQGAVSSGFASDRTLFASTSQDLFKSTDGGGSWMRLGDDDFTLAAVSPDYPDDHTIFATGAGGLYRSTDGGTTWITATQPSVGAGVWVWAISPQYAADSTLWVARAVSSSGPIGQLARSRDGGETWDAPVEIHRSLLVNAMALSPAFDQDGSALVGTEAGFIGFGGIHGLRATTDEGDTWPYGGLWSDCLDPSHCWPTAGFAVAFSPSYASDGTAFVGTRAAGVAHTTSGVANGWSYSTFPVTHTVRALAVSPIFSDDGRVWAGTDGSGVLESIDGGQTWSALNTGLSDLRVLGLAVSPDFATDKALFAATKSGLWVWGEVQLPFQVYLPLVMLK